MKAGSALREVPAVVEARGCMFWCQTRERISPEPSSWLQKGNFPPRDVHQPGTPLVNSYIFVNIQTTFSSTRDSVVKLYFCLFIFI